MEKYGTIPPRFTKAWWEYIWYYYKWHIVGTAVAVILITMTCVQCATAVDYDLTVSYVGKVYCDETVQHAAEQAMAEQIDDITGNGHNDVMLQVLAMPKDNGDAQYTYAMQTKLTLELSAGETFLYLFTKEQGESLKNSDYMDGLFLKVEDWCPESGQNGYLYDLKGNAFFESIGIPTDDLYMAVQGVRSNDSKKPKLVAKYENAVKLAKYIAAQDK